MLHSTKRLVDLSVRQKIGHQSIFVERGSPLIFLTVCSSQAELLGLWKHALDVFFEVYIFLTHTGRVEFRKTLNLFTRQRQGYRWEAM